MTTITDPTSHFLANLSQYAQDVQWKCDWYEEESLILRGGTSLDRLNEIASVFGATLNKSNGMCVFTNLAPGVMLRLYKSASKKNPYIFGFQCGEGAETFFQEHAHLFSFLGDLPTRRMAAAKRIHIAAETRFKILTALVGQ